MYHYSPLDEDFFIETNSNSEDFWINGVSPIYHSSPPYTNDKMPLREKNNRRRNSGYKHIPHKEKPPQVVAKRNARERRRVQAVNNAFVKLRNAVPIQNARGKRISKVKTLLHAMEYIRALDEILQNNINYTSYEMVKFPQFKDTVYHVRNDWKDFEKDNGSFY